MKFIDRFDTPSRAWMRGTAAPSERANWPELRSTENENHVTLSGMSVNPACFGEFSASFRFTFPKTEEGYVIFGFGKPFEWSSAAESGLQITIHHDGRGTLIDSDGSVLLEFALSPNAKGEFAFSVRKAGDTIEVKPADDEVHTIPPKEIDTAGYLTIQVENTPVRLCEFVLDSPVEAPPLTAGERQAGITAWKQWRMKANHQNLNELREYLQQNASTGRWGYDTDMTVSPGLVKPGEVVTVTCRSKNKPDSSSITMEPDYLGANGGARRDIALDWKTDENGQYVAQAHVTATDPGNGRIVWNVNSERLVRSFGVVEPGYVVCTLWVGSNFPDIDREIHKYDLHGEYWVGDWWSPFDKTPEQVLDYMKPLAAFRHKHGDILVPFVNAGWILPGIPNFNVFELNAELQTEGFALVRDFMDVLELGPMELLASYTMGHDTPAAASRAGAKGLTSLCVWQNWIDGGDDGWKINHWGCPIVPYYMADDDFRRVSPEQGIIGFSMGTATSVRNYSAYCFEGCPTNVIPLRRYTSDGIIPDNIHRFYYAVDGWLHDVANNTEPLFIIVSLENFVGREEWRKANEMAVDYLIQQAREKKVVFATSADVANYYLKNYKVQPKHVFYQPDVYCGIRPEAKPATLPDRIEFSNHLCHSLHVAGRLLPQILWDYTSPWENPEWDTAKERRVDGGLLPLELVVESGCVPENVKLQDVHVDMKAETVDGIYQVTLSLDLPSPIRMLPISLWQLPFTSENLQVDCDCDSVSWQSVVDGFTGNLNGLLLFENLPKGRTDATVKFQGRVQQPRSLDFTVGNSIAGREVIFNQQQCVYLWRTNEDKELVLELTLPSGKTACALSVDGVKIYPDDNGCMKIPFTNQWQHECYLICDAGMDDILADAHETPVPFSFE